MNNQLPYDCRNYQLQPMNYRNDMPPFIPNNAEVPPEFRYMLPFVCSMICNEATIKAANHPGRMFMYNKLSENNWNNKTFVEMVSTVFDVLLLGMYQRRFNRPEDGINEAIVDSMGLGCSLCFQMYPALQRETQPRVVEDAFANINIWHSKLNEIAVMRNSGYSYRGPVNNNNYQQNSSSNNYPQNNNSSYVNNQNNSSGVSSGLFSGAQQARPGEVVGKVDTNNRYDYIKNKQVVDVEAKAPSQGDYFVRNNNNQPRPEFVAPVAMSEDEITKTLKWWPSKRQPYMITINPKKHKLCLREENEDGKVVVVCYVVNLNGEEMALAREKHQIMRFGKVYTPVIPEGYNSRQEAFLDNLDKMSRVSGADVVNARTPADEEEVEKAIEVSIHTRPSWLVDTNFESALLGGRIKHTQLNHGKVDCTSYRVYTTIAKPVVSTVDLSGLIQGFAGSQNFRELATRIRNATNKGSSVDSSVIDFCNRLDIVLTREINSIIQNRMSIPGITIDSYVNDVCDLPGFFEENLGVAYRSAFLSTEKMFIEGVVSLLDDIVSSNLVDNLVEEDCPDVKLNFIPTNYSLTFVGLEVEELDFVDNEGTGSAILESTTPALNKLARDIFNQEKGLDQDIFHRLIITKDDKIYAVHKGLIGHDFYTISRFNQ